MDGKIIEIQKMNMMQFLNKTRIQKLQKKEISRKMEFFIWKDGTKRKNNPPAKSICMICWITVTHLLSVKRDCLHFKNSIPL